jgi:hypothetical protein
MAPYIGTILCSYRPLGQQTADRAVFCVLVGPGIG